jgi:long-chain acyl-CoA synthetase
MNIAHGLRRALQVNSSSTAAILEGRRRMWRAIGDRVSRALPALKPSFMPLDRSVDAFSRDPLRRR